MATPHNGVGDYFFSMTIKPYFFLSGSSALYETSYRQHLRPEGYSLGIGDQRILILC